MISCDERVGSLSLTRAGLPTTNDIVEAIPSLPCPIHGGLLDDGAVHVWLHFLLPLRWLGHNRFKMSHRVFAGPETLVVGTSSRLTVITALKSCISDADVRLVSVASALIN